MIALFVHNGEPFSPMPSDTYGRTEDLDGPAERDEAAPKEDQLYLEQIRICPTPTLELQPKRARCPRAPPASTGRLQGSGQANFLNGTLRAREWERGG